MKRELDFCCLTGSSSLMHVIGNFTNDMRKFTHGLGHSLTAVFEFEDWDVEKTIPVKDNLVAYYNGTDNTGQHLDFALLELDSEAKHPCCPELLNNYSPSPSRGGLCIIGHPGGGVK